MNDMEQALIDKTHQVEEVIKEKNTYKDKVKEIRTLCREVLRSESRATTMGERIIALQVLDTIRDLPED